MELILASGNTHKAQELGQLLPAWLKVVAAPEKLEVEENGASFQENALIKARAYFEANSKPVVSDDSGLVVNSLPDELGLYSARFGGEGLTDQERALLLLEKLQDYPSAEERAAYFVCHLCFYLSHDEIYFFEGRLNGSIAPIYRGEHGFGYDPVFVPKDAPAEVAGQTLAQIPEWKQLNSHRAIAARYAADFFKERHGQKS